ALMFATGIGFASAASFAVLLLVAFVGTLNPSAGDVSPFLPPQPSGPAGAGVASGPSPVVAVLHSAGGGAPAPGGCPRRGGRAGWGSARERVAERGGAGPGLEHGRCAADRFLCLYCRGRGGGRRLSRPSPRR